MSHTGVLNRNAVVQYDASVRSASRRAPAVRYKRTRYVAYQLRIVSMAKNHFYYKGNSK